MSIIDASAPHSVRSDYSTFAVGDVNGHDTGMHRSIMIERPPFTYSDEATVWLPGVEARFHPRRVVGRGAARGVAVTPFCYPMNRAPSGRPTGQRP